MSISYNLVCLPCRVRLYLGKVICFGYSDEEIPWQFEGPFPHDLRRDAFERFVLLHRNHAIRVLTASVIDTYDLGPDAIESLDSEELLALPFDPEPHPEADTELMEASLTEDEKRQLRGG